MIVAGLAAVRAPMADFAHESAAILAANGRWDDALDLWNIAIRIDPGLAPAWVGRAEARLHVEPSPSGALDDLSHALSLDPTSAAARQARAEVRTAQGDFHGAVDDATAALKLDPNLSGAYLTRGQAWVAGGNDVQAVADLQEAVRLKPRLLVAWITMAWTRSRLHDDAGAMQAMDRALHLDSQNPLVWANRAALRAGQGDVDGAATDVAESLRLGPRLARPLEVRAQVEACQGRYPDALADCDQAIGMRSTSAYAMRATVRSCQGDEKGALQDAIQSGETATKAAVEYENGQWQAAIDDYRKAEDAHQGSEGYFQFYQFLAHRRLQEKDGFRTWMGENPLTNPWEKSIAGYLLGDVQEDALLAQAHDAGQQCEAAFYIGSMHLLGGDKAGARRFYERAAATHLAPYYEFRSALAELRRL
jgi:tetratricopeptide (TPR) repeat protein